MPEAWPRLVMNEPFKEAYATLHLWAQVVGKIRLGLTPVINHWWNVPLYVTPRGLTTSTMPHPSGRILRIDFDFITHRLVIQTSDGDSRVLSLSSRTVSEFYHLVMEALQSLDTPLGIWTRPVELSDPIPFELDTRHRAYDENFARTFWRILASVEPVFSRFRSAFLGKCSPVQFFWGGFDLAVSRFSGRAAPEHGPIPNVAQSVVLEAYSHEVCSCGFWLGSGTVKEPAFFSYVYPEPPGYRERKVEPEGAYYDAGMGEFILPYERARASADPEETLYRFLQTTYEAAADLGGWDRKSLEREPRRAGHRTMVR